MFQRFLLCVGLVGVGGLLLSAPKVLAQADAAASVTLGANATVGAAGNTTLAFTLPSNLAADDTVVFTMPDNLDVSSVAYSSDTFGGAGGFSCADSGQVVTCTADGAITSGAGTIVMSGITSLYAATTQTVTNVEVTSGAGGEFAQVGNDLNFTTGRLALAPLTSTRVAYMDANVEDLRTYEFDGTDWAQVGNDLNFASNAPALAALSSTRVAFLDGGNDELRTYDFDGTDWSQTGNSLSIAGSGNPALASLSGSRVAFIDANQDDLRTYDFDGTDWAQVGNDLNISDVDDPALAAMSGTRVAFYDSTNLDLRTYDFDGTDWAQVGNDFNIVGGDIGALTALTSSRVVFADGILEVLIAYDFDGTDWAQVGDTLAITGSGFPALATLSSTRVAYMDGIQDDLRTYDFTGASVIANDASGTVTDTVAATLTSTNSLPQSLRNGLSVNVIVQFTTPFSVATTDEIEIVFPAGFDVSGAGGACSTMDGSFTPTVNLQTVTLARDGDGSVQTAAAEQCELTGVQNPSATGPTGTFTVRVVDGASNVKYTATISGVTITSGGGSQSSITGGGLTDGLFTNTEISFDVSDFETGDEGGVNEGAEDTGSGADNTESDYLPDADGSSGVEEAPSSGQEDGSEGDEGNGGVALGEATPFEDIEESSSAPAIRELYDKGVVQGKEAGVFSPDDLLTRAELVKITLRLFEYDVLQGSVAFPDVLPEEWYYPYVVSFYEYGFVQGYEDGTFRPGGNVTGPEALKVLFLAAWGEEHVLSAVEDIHVSDYNIPFDEWFTPYVSYALHLGILEEGDWRKLISRGDMADLAVKVWQLRESL